MSAPSSPGSSCSILMSEDFKPDPNVVKMLVTILIARHGVLHFHGQTGELATFQWWEICRGSCVSANSRDMPRGKSVCTSCILSSKRVCKVVICIIFDNIAPSAHTVTTPSTYIIVLGITRKDNTADQVGFIYGLAIEIELRRLYPNDFWSQPLRRVGLDEDY
ncbi:hypothetical protein EV424DRAFT_1346261 [Suillus variegatus]|nr:hypothetical protein EV424DRAFT_1346261 [Suillus variegatus]